MSTRICCVIPSPRTCSSLPGTCARCRKCSGIRASRPRRSTPISTSSTSPKPMMPRTRGRRRKRRCQRKSRERNVFRPGAVGAFSSIHASLDVRIRRCDAVCTPDAGRGAPLAERRGIHRRPEPVPAASRAQHRQRRRVRRGALSRRPRSPCRIRRIDDGAVLHHSRVGRALHRVRPSSGGCGAVPRDFRRGGWSGRCHGPQDGYEPAAALGNGLVCGDHFPRHRAHAPAPRRLAAWHDTLERRCGALEGEVSEETLAQLAMDFSVLSLIAVGGAITVLPEMHRSVVQVHGWMSGAQFAELFALAQAAPGPNILVVSLIGWKVAGLAGAVVATAAVCGPSCVLTFAVSRIWQRFRGARWRAAVEEGPVPVTVGLMLAGGYLITRSADDSWPAFVITAATAAVVLATRIHPLWLFGAAGLIGLAGWI